MYLVCVIYGTLSVLCTIGWGYNNDLHVRMQCKSMCEDPAASGEEMPLRDYGDYGEEEEEEEQQMAPGAAESSEAVAVKPTEVHTYDAF